MATKRIVQIRCPEKRGERDVACSKCGLPLNHHDVRWEVLAYDDFYDVYALHAVQDGGFNPDLSASTRLVVLHVSSKIFSKFVQFI